MTKKEVLSSLKEHLKNYEVEESLKTIITTISNLDSIPLKENKFKNFFLHSFKKDTTKHVDKVWEIVDSSLKAIGHKPDAPLNLNGGTKKSTNEVENRESKIKKNKNKRNLEETEIADEDADVGLNGQKNKKKRQKKNEKINIQLNAVTSPKAKKDTAEPKERKQEEWVKHLTNYLENNKLLDSSLQLVLKLIIKLSGNAPRSEKKFRNFIKNSTKTTLNEEQADKVWEIYQKALSKCASNKGESKNLNESTKKVDTANSKGNVTKVPKKKQNLQTEKSLKKAMNKKKIEDSETDSKVVDKQNGQSPFKRQRKNKGSKKSVKQK